MWYQGLLKFRGKIAWRRRRQRKTNETTKKKKKKKKMKKKYKTTMKKIQKILQAKRSLNVISVTSVCQVLAGMAAFRVLSVIKLAPKRKILLCFFILFVWKRTYSNVTSCGVITISYCPWQGHLTFNLPFWHDWWGCRWNVWINDGPEVYIWGEMSAVWLFLTLG